MNQQTAGATGSSEGRPKRAWVHIAAAAIGLSLFAVAIVLGNMAAGVPRQSDEDAWAHLFQLAMAVQVPLLLLFLAMADWRKRERIMVLIAAQIVAAAAALGTLAWSGY